MIPLYAFAIFGLIASLFFLLANRNKWSTTISSILFGSFILRFIKLWEISYYILGIGILLTLLYPFLCRKESRTKNLILFYAFIIPISFKYLAEIGRAHV